MIARSWRVLAILVLAALTFVVAPPAVDAAGPFSCKSAPTPDAPGTGTGGWFLDAPKTMPAGESWQNGAPVFEHYGYAGLRWNTYDLGCGSDLARNPGAVIGTEMANWLLWLPKMGVGLTNFTVHYAFHPTFLNVFDPLVIKAMTALKNALFDPWAILFLAFAGVLLLWKVQRMRLNQGLTIVGWAVLVFVLASAVFQWPLRAGQVTDQAVTTALGSINRGINGTGPSKDPADEVAQSLTNAILFEQWKSGEFGDANGAIATKYARPMWESQTLTWADAKTVADDPNGAGKRLLADKAKQYEDTAAKIKSEDPTAYEYVTGKRGDDRFGAAFMAVFAAAVACPFLLISCMLILAAFLLVRLAVIFLPAVATMGVAYQFRGMVKSLINMVAAAVINCIAFGAGASVTIMTIGVLLSPSNQLPAVLRLILVALVSFIMWVVLRPFRKLTQMVSANHNLFGSAATSLSNTGNSLTKSLLGLGKTALGSFVGNMVADKAQEKRERKERAKDEKLSEETTIIEPETELIEPETEIIYVRAVRDELGAGQQPAEIGTRPSHRENAPYERPAAHEPVSLDRVEIPDGLSTRPAHTEIGPYEATVEGGAVTPVQAVEPPMGAGTPVVDRPEYAGGSTVPVPKRDKPNDGIWLPTDGEHQRADESVGLVDLRDSGVVDETGSPVWPLWTPERGVSFDAPGHDDAGQPPAAPSGAGEQS